MAANLRNIDRYLTDEFVAAVKETVDNDGSQSYAKIAADMGCHKSTILRTIKKDNDYSFHRKSHRMFITNVSKETAALMNDVKHDQTSNRQNVRCICKDIEKVPIVKHTKFPSSVTVLGVISSEGCAMSPFFFQKSPSVTAEIYQEVLWSVVKPWMDEIAAGRLYVFQQDPGVAAQQCSSPLVAGLVAALFTLNTPDYFFLSGIIRRYGQGYGRQRV
ncbi:unnamed protein product [Acanthosepion pharaonis]|uniref:Uncharacterized protein n=1 Tax=Acanthosepion pharaonis TaxID=158019 RepID=A0A812C104_ACAPH|nr:unnamed protein product [Sepia pharaonis]